MLDQLKLFKPVTDVCKLAVQAIACFRCTANRRLGHEPMGYLQLTAYPAVLSHFIYLDGE